MWALVHSKSQNKVKQGLELAETRLGSKERPAADEQRELVYYCAVAFYKLGRYIDARRQLEELLKVLLHLAMHCRIRAPRIVIVAAAASACIRMACIHLSATPDLNVHV